MSQVQEAPAAHPFALANGEGERLWFINSEITIKATAASRASSAAPDLPRKARMRLRPPSTSPQ